MILRPRSLAGRTALVLLASLALVQVAGLTIHAFDRVDVIRLAQMGDAAVRAVSLYRVVILAPPDVRARVVKEFDDRDDADAVLAPGPPASDMPAADPALQRQIRASMDLVPMAPEERPTAALWLGGPAYGKVVSALRMPDGRWLNMTLQIDPPRPWHSSGFLLAFALMTLAAGGLTLWAMRRMVAPVVTLAAAAEQLGRDLNAPPLPENGPTEVAVAANAFNVMAARMRRLLADRNFMLMAIGHDLRTPITRMRLRAEFIDDDELRRKTLSDLDELEAMVSATLAVARDTAADEPAGPVDLVELVRTVLDETADARPDAADGLRYSGADHLTIQARPFALKRALTNLIGNAVAYGGCALVTLREAPGRLVSLSIEDTGPGIPPEEVERLFQPFQRLEHSRNRETGGIGLGLTIARNILRAHGGDVTIGNRADGGARALVTLPM